MIRRYNLQQTLIGLASLLLSAFAYASAWLFFRYMPSFIATCFETKLAPSHLQIIAGLAIMLISFSGYRLWKSGGGFSNYATSPLFPKLDPSTGGAQMVTFYTHRITAPAHLFSQLFLAGPLMFLRAVDCFRNRIKTTPELETSLIETRQRIVALNRWQTFLDHPGKEREILLLARMRQIDFSNIREPRFRA